MGGGKRWLCWQYVRDTTPEGPRFWYLSFRNRIFAGPEAQINSMLFQILPPGNALALSAPVLTDPTPSRITPPSAVFAEPRQHNALPPLSLFLHSSPAFGDRWPCYRRKWRRTSCTPRPRPTLASRQLAAHPLGSLPHASPRSR